MENLSCDLCEWSFSSDDGNGLFCRLNPPLAYPIQQKTALGQVGIAFITVFSPAIKQCSHYCPVKPR